MLSGDVRGLTFERLARAAGVSKTTLYKWWPSPGALILDAYFHAVADTLAFDTSTDIRSDLLHQLTSFVRLMNSPGGRVLLQLIGTAQTDPELADAVRTRYTRGRRILAYERFAAAQENGEIRPDVDVRVLVDQLWGAVYHRLLLPYEPLTEGYVTALVDNLLGGVGSGPFAHSATTSARTPSGTRRSGAGES